jgi:hypothetical protein
LVKEKEINDSINDTFGNKKLNTKFICILNGCMNLL